MGKGASLIFSLLGAMGGVREEEVPLWRQRFDITVDNVCNTDVK